METKGKRRVYRRHEKHVHAVLGALSGLEVAHRVAQPASTLEIDWVLRSSGASSWLSPLGGLLADRITLLEHYSYPPDVEAVGRCLRKLLVAHEEWRASKSEGRSPLLVIGCRLGMGHSRRFAPDAWRGVRGVWTGTPLPGASVLVIHGPRLPRDPEYDGWRVLLRVPGWEDNLLRLLGNGAVDKLETERAMEAIMQQQNNTGEADRVPLYKVYLERGREQGVRRAYLDLLQPLLSASEYTRLAEHATTEELARLVKSRLR